MHESEPGMEHRKRFVETRLGELCLTNGLGLAWGIGTFEAGNALFKLAFHQRIGSQALGLGLFGAAGLVFGKFMRSQLSRADDPSLIPTEDLRLHADY